MGATSAKPNKLKLFVALLGKATRRGKAIFKPVLMPLQHRLIRFPDVSHYPAEQRKGRYYFSPRDRDRFIDAWHKKFQCEDSVIDAADEVCSHVFDLLGSGSVSLGASIDWHSDFKSGCSWPANKPLNASQILQHTGYGDVKVPWELSRFQHCATLGKAYWLTQDVKYAREFREQVSHWIASNAWGRGINWACAMDVAIRASNWVMGYQFFSASSELNSEFRNLLLRSLWEHGHFIRKNLERGTVNGNHYISDLAGLFVLGVFFSNEKIGRKWRDFSFSELCREMRAQVLEDGVSYEKSISYHRLVLELFTYSFILAELNGFVLPKDVRVRWEQMFEFVSAYTKPDGNAPQIGDADDGVLYKLRTQCPFCYEDHRYLLSIGALIFNRNDFAIRAGEFAEEAFWLFGPESIQRFEHLCNVGNTRVASSAFSASGFYVIRDGDDFAIIDAGDNGLGGIGAHAHNDALSFELCSRGKTLVVDSGTYLYTADPCSRNTFRSTSAHNTVIIDNLEFSQLSDKWLFVLPDAGAVYCTLWKNDGDEIVFEGKHEAYRRLCEAVTHTRLVKFQRQTGTWVIEDSFSGSGTHHFESRIHLAPGVLPVILDQCRTKLIVGQEHFEVVVDSEVDFHLMLEEGWYSPSYGKKVPIEVLNYTWKAQVPCSFKISIRSDIL